MTWNLPIRSLLTLPRYVQLIPEAFGFVLLLLALVGDDSEVLAGLLAESTQTLAFGERCRHG
jgi:hypothetical protein